MLLVQDLGSGDTLTPLQKNIVTEPDGFNPPAAGVGGLNQLSERQQQALLLLIGYLWMGLMCLALTMNAEPKRPHAGAAKASPAQVTKPADSTPKATQPGGKAVKA
jgi:hypothetical protein